MQLSDNFTLAEFTVSQAAERLGLDNTPNKAIIQRLKLIASELEYIRAMLGAPIIINSGYRSVPVNKAIGGSEKSHHCEGWAVDFIAPKYGSPYKVCKTLEMEKNLAFDQLIYEGTWVHYSIAPGMRKQVLTMKGGKYLPGLHL